MSTVYTKVKTAAGFTMIELLAVVTIIGILFATGLVAYTNVARNARENRRQTDIQNIRQALVLYRSDTGCYPASGIANAKTALEPDYMTDGVPDDPQGATYSYTASGACATGTNTFCLCADLEDTTGGNSGANCAAGSGFYCVTNP